MSLESEGTGIHSKFASNSPVIFMKESQDKKDAMMIQD